MRTRIGALLCLLAACGGHAAPRPSAYGMHADYHTPGDEVARIDADHLAAMVQAAARAARLLADGVAPVWNPGGKP